MPRIKELKHFNEKKDHFYDDYKNLGYDWKRNIMRNVLTPEIFANPMNDTLFRQVERLFELLIDMARQVKLQNALTYPKDSELLN